MANGYLKLYRKMLRWEWYKDSKTLHLFIHLMFKANYLPSRFRGVALSPGQLITGRKRLAMETGLSEQSIRTSLNRLKTTNEITIESTKQFSIITIVNWVVYQENLGKANHQINQRFNQQLTNDQPTSNHIQEDKKEKTGRKKNKRGGGASPNKSKAVDSADEQAREVLEYLNKVTGKRFKVTGLIPARLKAGATVEECKRVIDYKVSDQDFQRKYLDHTTPFREANFDRYLNQALECATLGGGGQINEGKQGTKWQPDSENRWAKEVDSTCAG